jgi:hypothetical protein
MLTYYQAVQSKNNPVNHDKLRKKSQAPSQLKLEQPATHSDEQLPEPFETADIKTAIHAVEINISKSVSIDKIFRDVQLLENHGNKYIPTKNPEISGEMTANTLYIVKLNIRYC